MSTSNVEYSFFTEKRHLSIVPSRNDCAVEIVDWRLKDRLKTVSVAIVLCLNIGIDPPDILKPDPAPKLEAWVDPFLMPPQKALENIGKNLQQQYEVWQPRARYRISPDPSIEEIKKVCCSLRRNAKEERILFHYNGHGVPRPTSGGELWVFNKNYTQYIPVSVYDLQSWLGSPCIFVYDCSNSGNILLAFKKYAEQRDQDQLEQPKTSVSTEPAHESVPIESEIATTQTVQDEKESSNDSLKDAADAQNIPQLPYTPFSECIQLCACGPKESLPMHPDLPADLFTCCLTTPIVIALKWFASKNPLLSDISPDLIARIPGRLNDRRTPLGELNWIFTAVTDTIAWNVLPHQLFSKLFRQDLMVAALFRNFLLADRIMRYYKCTPMSTPVLPSTFKHSMWDAWDLAAELCLFQLPSLIEAEEKGQPFEYKYSTFFTEQLSAFEVWLTRASTRKDYSKKMPEQLPVVLQVLLSQVHRLRALMLLSKFLDLGSWAVNSALSVGIFPYILKLLQSPAAELKPVLVFIWAKILAVDKSCQTDLLKDSGFTYFINILSVSAATNAAQNISEQRAMCAFILSVFCDDFRQGQQACIKNDLVTCLVYYMDDPDPLLRQWTCLCLSKLYQGYPEAKWMLLKDEMHEKLLNLLFDPFPEVRAASLHSLGQLLKGLDKTEMMVEMENDLILALLPVRNDASSLVRKELVHTLSIFVQDWLLKFVTAAYELFDEEKRKKYYNSLKTSRPYPRKFNESVLGKIPGRNSIYSLVWRIVLVFSTDPCKQVAELAAHLVDMIHLKMMSSPLMEQLSPLIMSDKSSKDWTNRLLEYIPALQKTSSNHSLTESSYDLNQICIPSDFYSWSREYFAEPQMRIPEVDDPGSIAYTRRTWREGRNEGIVTECQFLCSKESLQVRSLSLGHSVKKSCFHKFESFLAFIDEKGEARIFDWSEKKLTPVQLDHPAESVHWINEYDESMLMTISKDAHVSIFSSDLKLVTGWSCIDIKSWKSSILSSWSSTSGVLICTSTFKESVVNFWDVDREQLTRSFSTDANLVPSAIEIEEKSGQLGFIGFNNGTVQLFDCRADATIVKLQVYSSAISKLNFANNELLVQNSEGELLWWDIRKMIAGDRVFSKQQSIGPNVSIDFQSNFQSILDHSTNDLSLKANDLLKSTIRLPHKFSFNTLHPLKPMVCLGSASDGLIIDYY